METKDVLEAVKGLEKNKNNNDVVLKLLQSLDKDLKDVNEKLLRETKVGVVVNQFKKSSDPEVVKLVKKMIMSWKDVVAREKKSKLSANSSSTSNSNGTSGAEAVKKEKYVSKTPRNAKNDAVKTDIYGVKIRDMAIRALYDALAKESEHPPVAILDTVLGIETEMANLFNPETDEKGYREKYRMIYSNIISKNNPDLKHRITNGEITAKHLVNADPKDLAPEHLKKRLEEIEKQNLFNAQGATVERSVTDRFQCGKCKQRKVSYYQLQTRSADEPLTTFCTCEVCGNRWKFS
ncbi:unnamed protein product [Kluyveromyces dobzhanskii CBS 2104]|uniref:Transcription elongation factor n=1 Tax=Kluyveromyces dobzhanskii CBS 2104 TaxID=1427455 RepID=A0A0A8L9P0_9SACH|nr:unnamed protein product [Kluyveromyces dobzhanskii CBS 2104]